MTSGVDGSPDERPRVVRPGTARPGGDRGVPRHLVVAVRGGGVMGEAIHLCWLHEDGDDHWVTLAELVDVITRHGEVLRPDLSRAQAARSCAEGLNDPERIAPWGGRR